MKAIHFVALLLLPCLMLAGSFEEAELAYADRAADNEGSFGSEKVALKIVDLYRTALAEDRDNLEIRWKLMRAIYYHGRYTGISKDSKQTTFESLLDVGREGFSIIDNKFKVDHEGEPEDIAKALKDHHDALHVFFYQAAGWGQWALVYGKLKAVRKGAASKIRDYASVCYLADPAMDSAGAQRILGRLHHQTPKVPFISGWASKKEARKYLNDAWTRGRENPMNGLFLGELLIDLKKREDASKVLTAVASMEPREKYVIEDRDSIKAAGGLLKGL